MNSFKHYLIGIAISLLCPALLMAQYFGKNKVQYSDFKWKYIQSEHFDIYFTEGGEGIAEFVADVAEESHDVLMEDFRYELTDRITIIVYNGHNDFEQTNVDLAPPEESVGGFTEFFKNRVVIPFEGDWEQLRHVVHHELTHAVMLQMVYGPGVQSIVAGLSRLRLPLWFVEGLAEYESRGWDTESDMFMRDATLNGYVPPVDRMWGFLAYKGGQSVWYYLAEKYGREKVGEILRKVKISRNLEQGLKRSIGMNTEDLSNMWYMHLKREYWPDIAGRKEPEEFARRLTDHRKEHNFINNSPALSPRGDKIAFLSDRSDYFDIWLISAVDGRILAKLVSGQKSANLEELHWLRPGISWSPDGKLITFASKAGKEDALHIVDVKKKKIIKSMNLGLDGIFSPAWSPLGDEIAFVGTKNGRSDIYVIDLQTEKIRKITDDVFSDLEPSWSPDGKYLAFVSDRGTFLNLESLSANFKIQRTDYRHLDVYLVDAEGKNIRRITDTPLSERTPVFCPLENKLAYTSDRSGIYNIYIRDLETGIEYSITNVLTGIFHLSWAKAGEACQIAFISFYHGGYDLYLLKNPIAVKSGEMSPSKTNFLTRVEKRKAESALKVDYSKGLSKKSRHRDQSENKEKYRQFIFDKDFARGFISSQREKPDGVSLDSSQYLLASGEYKINNYKIEFSPDIIYGSTSYSQYFGLQGTSVLSLSDVLGNHRINIYTDFYYNLKNSNYQVTYFYLPKRVDYGVGFFHNVYFFLTSYDFIVRDRIFGLNLYLSRPFSRFRRVDLGFTWFGVNRDWPELEFIPMYKRRVILGSFSLITDTALWGLTGPINGSRSSFGVIYSPGYGENGLNFLTLRMDWRKYFKFLREYNFVLRIAGGVSEGRQPQKFFLGGIDNWINQKYNGGNIRVDNVEEIYFSSFETPLRGVGYYEKIGNRFMLMNLELRFPLIRYLLMGWPLPIALANVRGALFIDIGSAWDKADGFRPFQKTASIFPQLEDLIMGYGIGARTNLGFLVLLFDVAWTTDWARSSPKPQYLFSFGTEF